MPSTKRTARKGRKTPRNSTTTPAARPSSAIVEFYARALAIERAAAERYRDFAREMTNNGNFDTAELFERLADFESEHEVKLLEATAAMKLPRAARKRLSAADAASSEVPTYEFLYRRVTPQHALLMALASERRAKAFFERTRSASADAEIKKLAAEFAREEAEHVAWLEEALAVQPQPAFPFGDPVE